MPYSYPDAIPQVAKNWKPDEQRKCTEAAQAVLADGKSDQEAIFACIHAAGKSREAVELLNLAEETDWHVATSETYLDKFKALVLGLGVFSDEQVEGLVKTARGYAGGKASGDSKLQAKLDDMTPLKLKGLAAGGLVMAHRRLHAMWGEGEDSDKAEMRKIHDWMIGEMGKRKVKHYRRDELDDAG